MQWKYKEEKSFEERCQEAERMLRKYPNRIPVIVEKFPESNLPQLSQNKFLVEMDSPAAHFLYIVKKRLPGYNSQEGVFFLVKKDIVVLSTTMGDIYSKYADKDKFLYICYAEQNVFGADIFQD